MSPKTKQKPKAVKKRMPATLAVKPAPPQAPSASQAKGDLARYRENLQGEIDAVALYSVLMEKESSTALREFYGRMVEVEEVHALLKHP